MLKLIGNRPEQTNKQINKQTNENFFDEKKAAFLKFLWRKKQKKFERKVSKKCLVRSENVVEIGFRRPEEIQPNFSINKFDLQVF